MVYPLYMILYYIILLLYYVILYYIIIISAALVAECFELWPFEWMVVGSSPISGLIFDFQKLSSYSGLKTKFLLRVGRDIIVISVRLRGTILDSKRNTLVVLIV